jgi:ADP-heptose:LPS heptosyltransferase/glycosyltransferase involved in cell wall biosynthesis/2-polyprenyl-3-methyl-5-hydroxy-6-metoxy-1,4-benzoquinol methylase
MNKCFICGNEELGKVSNSPYWECSACSVWAQYPIPPKKYESDEETKGGSRSLGHLMSDDDKEANKDLADKLLEYMTLNNIECSRAFDIGSKYPYLSKCLKDKGIDAYGMDGIDDTPEYSASLNVPMIYGDFESMSVEEILAATGNQKFNLITMIHVMEHMYQPVEALKKMKELLTPDGMLFLRLPDHGVSGFERDCDEYHYSIHPFFHSIYSLLELLVQGKDLFKIEWTEPMTGTGQRNLILRPITKKPSMWCGMIVKNEERDLPKCLDTIKDVVDGLVLVDTGSTDKTLDVANTVWKKPLITEVYTDASKQDEAGDWKLWNFSKARNRFVSIIDDMPDVDYILWMDADDTLITPESLRRAIYLDQPTVFAVYMEAGGIKWLHHRIFKTKHGIDFTGWIHEYLNFGPAPSFTLADSIIHHDSTPGIGESSNDRNLRILLAEYQETQQPRTAFYLANTYKDAAKWPKAIEWYNKRIEHGVGYRDEYLFCYLYKIRAERANNDLVAAKQSIKEALLEAPDWSEFHMENAYIAYQEKNYQEAIQHCRTAANQYPPETQLWREFNKYRDQPLRLASFCYEHLGNKELALRYAEYVRQFVNTVDVQWEERIKALAYNPVVASVLARSKPQPKRIALIRPGAIGDCVMILNLVPALKKKYPKLAIDFFTNVKGLETLMLASGIENVYPCSEIATRRDNYRNVYSLVGYPIDEGYPKVKMNKHLINYFALELGLPEKQNLYRLAIPKSKPLVAGSYCSIHPVAGWSKYKELPFEKWEEVIRAFPDIKFIQIGSKDDYKLIGADHTFMGTDINNSINIIQNAKLHLGIDSFSNHITHMTGTPSIILFGSTQYDASGYPENTNISIGASVCPKWPCFWENPEVSNVPGGVCDNHLCMNGITVEMISEEVKKKLGV